MIYLGIIYRLPRSAMVQVHDSNLFHVETKVENERHLAVHESCHHEMGIAVELRMKALIPDKLPSTYHCVTEPTKP
jgi:hypothetical protein